MELDGTAAGHSEEDDEEAFRQRWALRVRECRQPACRRHRRCMYAPLGRGECRMEARYPFTEEEVKRRVQRFRALIRQELARREALAEARQAEEARAQAARRKSRSGRRGRLRK